MTAETRESVEGTTITDTIRYVLPGGALGDVLNSVIARNELKKLFRFRQRRLREIMPVVARQAGLR